ncbi:hypothetical protein PIB30_005931 [Stylosanthes scabra]|uniref:Uncharacterized protein n=1 Tax=Stylosanthes scabra TaxID=79078 RepID=A0ABU6S3W0_9FABA|nr:hypothetical protein [Stylosanthes scabra]
MARKGSASSNAIILNLLIIMGMVICCVIGDESDNESISIPKEPYYYYLRRSSSLSNNKKAYIPELVECVRDCKKDYMEMMILIRGTAALRFVFFLNAKLSIGKIQPRFATVLHILWLSTTGNARQKFSTNLI